MRSVPNVPLLRIALALLIGTIVAQSAAAQSPQWRRLDNAPSRPAGGRHDDVFFIDEFTGWVCNLTGEVWKTTDGGFSWTSQISQPEAFRSIAFLDHDRGFLGSIFDVNLLFETFDGGDSWTRVQNLPALLPEGICGLWPVDDQVIYGCGRFSGTPVVIKSTDAGATWESFDLSAQVSTLVDCYFVSPDSGFVVGGLGEFQNSTTGTVLSTGDGGASWQVRWQGDRLEEWGWKIDFPTADIGYVSLERSALNHRFLKTVDGGATWTPFDYGAGSSFRLQAIGFSTPDLGWIGGNASTARQTTDGGLTWAPTNWGVELNRVFMLRDDLGYSVGQHVYKYSVDALPTSTPTPSLPAVVLDQNQPNPFNPVTVIPFYLDEENHVRVVVYDPRGRRMATLLDDLQAFGEHRVVWNGRDEFGDRVASGVYYYRLEAGEFFEIRKMTLLK